MISFSKPLALVGLIALTAIQTSAPTHAETPENVPYPSAVATFEKVCLMSGVDPKDRVTAIEADGSWKEDEYVTVDVPQMAISKALDKNYSFSAPGTIRQWTGTIDGKKARLVTAAFDGKVRYPNLCAIVFEGTHDAMAYGRSLRDAFKAFGIGGKSVDLIHYYEFAGRIGDDRHPVRGEVFSRSMSGQIKETMHIYVAY
jgi:hypothetical protein